MTDESREGGADPEGSTGVAESTPPAAEKDADKPPKLNQQVEIKDVGPCKKHIKVSIDRTDLDSRLSNKFSELVPDANMAGFRPGKAPRKLVEKHYQKEVGDQVKAEVLLQSLEQLAEDHDIAPLSAPNIDPFKIELPKQGPMLYEFEVEVRPHFDLPTYKGLKLKRPVKTFTEDDVAKEERRLLVPYGQVIPKPQGIVEVGDVVTADVVTKVGTQVLSDLKELSIRVDPQLAFKDGVAEHFADQMKGAKVGDTRKVDIKLSSSVAVEKLRGATVQATFAIKDVKTVRLPELTHEFLHNFGVHSVEQFHELLRVFLERRLEYQQRQSARDQVMGLIAAAATWELPEDLLARQARKALARKVMEMRSEGIPEEEIRGRQRLLQQDILANTALALKEHFVLQKIAEVEKIEVDDADVNDEIERIAEQYDESPRKVRARLEKDDLLETLAAEIVERKALDLILDSAEYEDVPLDQTDAGVSEVEEQAVPGEMIDPTAAAETAEEPAAPPAT
jgi:trigger factor